MKIKILQKIPAFMFMLLVLCSQSVYSQEAPSLLTPTDKSTANAVKPTFVWQKISVPSTYEILISKDPLVKTNIIKATLATDIVTYTLTGAYLEYNTDYYWRVRAVNPGGDTSGIFTFNTGKPSSDIGVTNVDANAVITFDHTTGSISQMAFKSNYNNQILNAAANSKNKFGLGMVAGESNTKLVSWDESVVGTYVYNYENTLYGSKTLTIMWGVTGINVQMTFNLLANKSITLNAVWQPGGDIGPLHDYILYNNAGDTTNLVLQTYPSAAAKIYQGKSDFVALFDDRYDEYFGYTFPVASTISLQQGVQSGPAISNTVDIKNATTFNVNFALMKKADFFTATGSWAPPKAIIVQSPALNAQFYKGATPTITWKDFGVSEKVDVLLSIDGGATFPTTLASNIVDAGSKSVTLNTIAASCQIKVMGHVTNTIYGVSNLFTVVDVTSCKFSVSTALTEAPTDQVQVPIVYTAGSVDLLAAFDVRLNYDPSVLTFVSFAFDPFFARKTGNNPNWSTDALNNTTSGYIQIGAFDVEAVPQTGLVQASLTSSQIGVATFLIKSTARVGTSTVLNVNNKYLSATNTSVVKVPVIGSDGLLTFYTRTSGNVRYFITSTPVYADGLIQMTVTNGVRSGAEVDANVTVLGTYNYANIQPGDNVVIALNSGASKKDYPGGKISSYVNSIDARMAFDGRDGGSRVLTPLQKISADINQDGVINSFDAFAILQISTGAKSIKTDFNLDKWVFIDSSFTLTDKNWTSAPTTKTYLPLDSVKTKQSFWAIIRGDLDGGYNSSVKLSKTGSIDGSTDTQTDVQFVVPANIKAQPGDTVLVPLTVKLNGHNLGGFNTSINIDKTKFTFTGKFDGGASIPWNLGWVVSTNYDSNGILNIGATDFSGALDPILTDGTLLTLKYVVNKQAAYGDYSPITIDDIYASDSKLVRTNVVPQNGKVTVASATAVGDNNLIPTEYSLNQNYPNPFNPSTIIEYSLKQNGLVKVEVYNILGERLASLVNQEQPAGKYKVEWNASQFASGIYFYRINSGNFSQTKKMILIK